jgi:hypothetical protein
MDIGNRTLAVRLPVLRRDHGRSAARTHPNLVPYDDLDQSIRDYDTEQVKQAAGYLLDAP